MTAQSTHKARQRPAKGRITRKTAQAISLIATKGMTQREAAQRAGMNEKALSRALNQPHVREKLEEQKAQVIKEIEQIKGLAKAIAIETGMKLMQDAKSEAVKARLVEFFAGETKSAGVSVTVNNTVTHGNGYEYLPPGSHMVEIEGQAEDVTDQPRIGEPVRDRQSPDNDDETQ